MDAGGYIRTPLEEVAAALSLEIEEMERILGVLQSFDPPGICARDLAECLALQLKEKNRYDPFMERLLDNLDLIAACDFQRLRKLCGVDQDDMREMIAELRQLNPKPGADFETAEVETLVPDVIVKRGPDGAWKAELNPNAAPSLAVDRAYYASLKIALPLRRRPLLFERPVQLGQLARQKPGAAPFDHPQGGNRRRRGAIGLFRSRRAAFEAPEPASDRHQNRHARVHRQPRDLQQGDCDAARHLRNEVFLHERHRLRPARQPRRTRPKPCATASRNSF